MDNNERHEHFKGFARLTLQKLMNKYDHLPPGVWGPAESDEIILAQCAYDLAEHVYNHTTEAMPLFDSFAVVVELDEIPDLTEWPKTE